MRMIPAVLLAGLCLGAVSCTHAPAKDRPGTVEDAADAMLALLDERNRHELAYMRDGDLNSLHHGFGMTVRAQFGMWDDNKRLLKDCKDPHPESCSMEVIGRMHAKLRGGLPADERARLEKLESGMDRVRLPPRDFRDIALSEFVAFLQNAVDAQLPEAERFRIRFAPGDAHERVFVEVRDGSLYDLHTDLFTHLEFSKAPPDLWVRPL